MENAHTFCKALTILICCCCYDYVRNMQIGTFYRTFHCNWCKVRNNIKEEKMIAVMNNILLNVYLIQVIDRKVNFRQVVCLICPCVCVCGWRHAVY